ETSEKFIHFKKKHSAVESAINGLENHGLDRCPDNGIHGFKRYIGLAVLARNLQIIGHHIQQKELIAFQQAEQKAA
ncbi:MAG: ISNCY family transposase, partial [Desulfobacterium sp.]|nr:ISNCY family transposase [Desulfobacterium sp.]